MPFNSAGETDWNLLSLLDKDSFQNIEKEKLKRIMFCKGDYGLIA